MVKVRYILLFVVVLMTVTGCHRKKEKPQVVESPDVEVIVDSSAKNVKGGTVVGENTSKGESELQFQTDTATQKDWRGFARKQSKIYSPALLTGIWKKGSLQQQYRADGTGLRWDEADDVSHAEAQGFSWTMDSNCLTLYFTMTLGGIVPKEYLVTYVDEESLVYKDAYGTSYMWDKVTPELKIGD